MFCEHCLAQIINKLNANDMVVLEHILKKNATIPQFSLSFDNVKEGLEMSPHNVYTSIKRLHIFGFIETQNWQRNKQYYITEDGKKVLELISKKIEEGENNND